MFLKLSQKIYLMRKRAWGSDEQPRTRWAWMNRCHQLVRQRDWRRRQGSLCPPHCPIRRRLMGLEKTDRFNLAHSQPLSWTQTHTQTDLHAFTYKRHPTQHGNFSGLLVRMNAWRRRRADCQTISVKCWIPNRPPLPANGERNAAIIYSNCKGVKCSL